MASQAQIEANRRNSRKSTGPRTDVGKAASSQNATRSGLYAASVLIDGEDPGELDALVCEYLDTCCPVGPRERAAVDSLIHTDWLLRRMRHIETQDWNSEFRHLRESRGDAFRESEGLISAYIRIEERIDRIQRRITTLERLYHRRLAELERLQAQRPQSPGPEPPPAPSPDAAPTTHPEIGFVPSESLCAAIPAPPQARQAVAVPDPPLAAPAQFGVVSSKSIPNPVLLTDRRPERI